MTALSCSRNFTAIVLAGALAGEPLSAAPLYTVAFINYTNESSVSSATPFGRDSSYALPPSGGYGLATGRGYSRQGRVGATHSMDLTWNSGGGAYSSGTSAICKTDDLIITGPANPTTIAASLNLRLRSEHSLMGGYLGNGGHASRVQISLYAQQAFYPFGSFAHVFGDFRYTNAGPYSDGVLAGQTGPSLDVPFTLSANFPVNIPFAVVFRLDASGFGYGNTATNPGMTKSDAGGNSSGLLGPGLRLAQVNNQVDTPQRLHAQLDELGHRGQRPPCARSRRRTGAGPAGPAPRGCQPVHRCDTSDARSAPHQFGASRRARRCGPCRPHPFG